MIAISLLYLRAHYPTAPRHPCVMVRKQICIGRVMPAGCEHERAWRNACDTTLCSTVWYPVGLLSIAQAMETGLRLNDNGNNFDETG